MSISRIGIDIGSSRIRMALTSREPVRLDALDAVDMPAGGIVKGIVQPAIVGPLIRELWERLGTNERHAVIVVGHDVARVKYSRFPAKGTATQRHAAARYAAEEMLPGLAAPTAVGPESEAVVDLAVGAFTKENTGVMVVPVAGFGGQYAAIAAVRKDAMNAMVAAVRQAGLLVTAVDVASRAMRRALPGASAVLDVGLRSTRLVGYGSSTDVPREPLVRDLEWGGSTITSTLAFELIVDEEAAEDHKRDTGSATKAMHAFAPLERWLSETVPQLREDGADFEAITMIGNGALVVELGARVAEATAFPGRLATLRSIDATLPPELVAKWAPEISLAFGASLFGAGVDLDGAAINLLRVDNSGWAWQVREALEEPRTRLAALACAAAILFAIATPTVQWQRLDREQSELRNLTVAEKSLSVKAEEAQAFASGVERIVALREELVQRRESSKKTASTIAHMENMLPAHVALRSIRDVGAGWQVEGRTRQDPRYIATALRGLDTIPGFSARSGEIMPVDDPGLRGAHAVQFHIDLIPRGGS